jgi:ABC-2 type transport system permease protein
MALKTQLLASLQHMGEMQAANPPEQQVFTTDRIVAQAEGQFESSTERPLVTVIQMRPGQLGQQEEPQPLGGPQISVPGFTVLFVFLSAGTTALSIYNEKKVGSFRRLLAAPMSKAELLLGKMLPQFFVALIQVVVIFGVGMFIMPLVGLKPLELGDHPLAVLVIVLVMALCATGMGVLIAAIARTEGQIGGVSAAALWVMGALGGAFFPVYLIEGFLGQIGQVVPHFWASKAFYGVLARGQDLGGVITEIGFLLGFTVLFFLIGVWRFEFD